MTYRERLALSEAFHEFEDLTGLHLSEAELEAFEEQAQIEGLSMSAYFERSLDRVKTAQAELRSENVTKH